MKHKPGWFENILLKLSVSRFDIYKKIDGVEELYLRRFHILKRLNPEDFKKTSNWKKFWLKISHYGSRGLKWITNGRYDRLFLHHILLPDLDRHLHDHPWNFAVLILTGGYWEDIPHPKYLKWKCGCGLLSRYWGPLSFRTSPGTQLHKISQDGFKTSWTILLASPKYRTWGFMTEDGWTEFDKYLAKYCPEQSEEPDDPYRYDDDSYEEIDDSYRY